MVERESFEQKPYPLLCLNYSVNGWDSSRHKISSHTFIGKDWMHLRIANKYKFVRRFSGDVVNNIEEKAGV